MPAPSPIHRDPDGGCDDYGRIGPHAAEGDAAISALVDEACRRLSAGNFIDWTGLLHFIRCALERVQDQHDCGSCDTVVKENVFGALNEAVVNAQLENLNYMDIYGW